jgi:hypothetical protein
MLAPVKYLKYLLFAAMIYGLSGLATVSTNPCSSHNVTPIAVFNDTIRLVSSPQPVILSRFGAMDTVQLWQSCRCLFRIQQIGQGGDTKFFLMHRLDPDTAKIPLHQITFSAPASGSLRQPYSAWYAFSTITHYGNTKYDTVRVSGYFK